ncbi:hypothetical protein LTS18_012944, partial [Coniosporium uncinatum]
MAMEQKGSLLRLLIRNHSPAWIKQWAVTFVDAIFYNSSPLAMWGLLRLLEQRDQGLDVVKHTWLLVFLLGASLIISELTNNWMWWLGYCHLAVPIRAQLAALIFAKAMRRKDMKGATTSKDKEKEGKKQPDEIEVDKPMPTVEVDKHATGPGDDLEESLQKSRQGVVNLVGVDASRVANFANLNNFFFGSFWRLIAAFSLLWVLVGWQALLCGLAVQLLFLPVNIYFSKKYTLATDELMTARDKKLAVLNEALAGIRQIKFSALERQWEGKIRIIRENELGRQWAVFRADTVLIFCWLMGPILLSAACIGVYAVLNNGLPPSVAFTTITILSNIEMTLAFLPELTTTMLDAYTSLKRIEEFLDAPEKEQNTVPGDSVRFENVTIAWPNDGERGEDAFKLQDLNLDFPNGELSVISGRTGSGKSMLLAAILGE